MIVLLGLLVIGSSFRFIKMVVSKLHFVSLIANQRDHQFGTHVENDSLTLIRLPVRAGMAGDLPEPERRP